MSEETTPQAPDESFQQFMERAREANEEIMKTARQAGEEMLQAYVSWLEGIAEEQKKVASGPPVSEMDWMAAMLNAQADFTRQFANSIREFSSRMPK